jgi:hypothetical protein
MGVADEAQMRMRDMHMHMQCPKQDCCPRIAGEGRVRKVVKAGHMHRVNIRVWARGAIYDWHVCVGRVRRLVAWQE